MSIALQARDWTRALEQDEARRTGAPISTARKAVARRVGATPAALEHVSRGRAKRITAELFSRLQRAVIDKLQREISRAEHELHLARQSGLDPRSPEMAALEGAAEAARVHTRWKG